MSSCSTEPVVQRPVVFELERADRMGDAFDRIALSVRVVVRRVDAPGVAGAVMMGVLDAVHHRIAQIELGDAMSIFARKVRDAIGKLAGLHLLEQFQVFLDRCGRDTGCFCRAR